MFQSLQNDSWATSDISHDLRKDTFWLVNKEAVYSSSMAFYF